MHVQDTGNVLKCVAFSVHGNRSANETISIVRDFEIGLMKALIVQFPDAQIAGFFYHHKQVIRRRLMKDHVPPGEVSID